MAKTAKLKHPSKPSTHSRASRRAPSPSLPHAPRPPPSKPDVLAPRPSAGVSKPVKKKGGKILKRKQKLRLEQGKEKAEAVNGKLERKVERAERMREGKRGRNADWDELNEKISGKKKVKKVKNDTEEKDEDEGWEDQEMDVDGAREVEMAVEGSAAPATEAKKDAPGTTDATLENVQDEIL